MTTQPLPLRLATVLENKLGGAADADIEQAAAELRRLHEAHDWQYKMAGERLRRIEKLERVNQELLEALKYHQQQTRPIQRTIDAIAKHGGQA